MFPAATKGGGNGLAFPDTCKTPAPPPVTQVPIPYPNTAMLNTADGSTCSQKVKIMNSPVVTKNTQIPQTSGDEAGTLGGVVSGMNMGAAAFKTGVTKVKVEGSEIVNQLKPVACNGTNANAPAGVVVSPSQTKVIIIG